MPPLRQVAADWPRTVSRIDWKDPVRAMPRASGFERGRLRNETWKNEACKRKTDVRGV
jgi:hypothetical protein